MPFVWGMSDKVYTITAAAPVGIYFLTEDKIWRESNVAVIIHRPNERDHSRPKILRYDLMRQRIGRRLPYHLLYPSLNARMPRRIDGALWRRMLTVHTRFHAHAEAD
jgi:hypothetical protein